MDDKSSHVNKSVVRALRLLDLFDDQHIQLTATEIAELLNTTRATIYPTLHTLQTYGYLFRDDRGRYVLGMKLVERSGQKLAHLEVREIARSYLRDLAQRLGASTHLATLHGNEVLYLDRAEARPTVVLRGIVGRRVSAHCTALGKSLLAYLPHEELERIARSLDYVRHTARTITTSEGLLKELELVRQRGYALEIEESQLGNAEIAAPIRWYNSRVIAAIGLFLDASELRDHGPEERAKHIVRAATEVSCALGYQEEACEL